MKLRTGIAAVADRLCRVELFVATVMFSAMLLMMLIQVFFRYVIHLSLAWSEELMRFMYIASSFIGAAAATKLRQHVEINFIATLVNNSKKRSDASKQKFLLRVDVFAMLVSTVITTYLSSIMFRYTGEFIETSQVSIALLMPMSWLTATLAVSLALCAFHALLNLIVSALNLAYHGREAVN